MDTKAQTDGWVPADFKAALTELGWKQVDFWRKTGINKDTPRRWLKGTTPIPRWVPIYIGAMLDLKRLHAKYIAPSKGEETAR